MISNTVHLSWSLHMKFFYIFLKFQITENSQGIRGCYYKYKDQHITKTKEQYKETEIIMIFLSNIYLMLSKDFNAYCRAAHISLD